MDNNKKQGMLKFTTSITIAIIGLSQAVCYADEDKECGVKELCHYITPTGTAAFVSDYIWRGVSQTLNNPTMQGELAVSSIWGPYMGIWGSSVNFPDLSIITRTASSELDIYGGLKHTFFDKLTVDGGVVRYEYPGTLGLSFNEVYGKISYLFFSSLTIGGQIYYSGNVFDIQESGTYFMGNFNLDIPEKYIAGITEVSVFGHVGRYLFSGPTLIGRCYTDFDLGVGKAYKVFNVAVSVVGTNGDFQAGKFDDTKALLTVSASI